MKLYIWYNALCDYTCGIIVAHANSLEEAKTLILEDKDNYISPKDLSGAPEILDENEAGFAVCWGGG